MASFDESNDGVDIEIAEVASPGEERRQRVREDLESKRVELELREQLALAWEEKDKLRAEVERLRNKDNGFHSEGMSTNEPLINIR